MAESRRRRRARSRRSYQPALPPEVRAAQGGSDPSDDTEARRTERELLQDWKAKVARARRLRSEWEDKYTVETLECTYLGDQTLSADDSQRAELWLNHFAATVKTQRPSILPTKLSFLTELKPGQPASDKLMVRAMGSVLDTIAAQDGHLMKILRLAAMQAFFRIGVLKVSYDPRLEPNPRAGEPLLDAERQPLFDAQGKALKEPEHLMTDELYRWQWVNAKNMLLPDEGPDMTRWTWIGEECEVPLEDAQEDTRFPEALRSQLRANGRIRDPQASGMETDAEREQREEAMFRYTEVWDMRQNKQYIWADGQPFDTFLVNDDLPDGVEDNPYAILAPDPIIAPEPCPWPKPLVYDWLPMQREYNILRQQMLNAAKRSARKVYYDQNTFPDADEAQKALSSPKDMEAVMVNDTGRVPVPQTDPPLGSDVARNIPYLLSDWQRVTGSSGTRLGDPDSGTATEAVIGEQQAAVRDSELRTMVLEWLTEAGKKMLQLVRQTLTLDLWIQLREFDDRDIQQFLQSPGFLAYLALRVGEQNVQPLVQLFQVMPGMQELLRERFVELKPLKVTRSQLQQEADVTVLPSTIRPVYRAQLLQLTGLLGPAALLSPTLIEELLASFELPGGDRIAEEIVLGLRQQQQAQAAQQQARTGGGGTVPGAPNPQSAASPIGTQNTLGAVVGANGVA